MVVIVVKRYAVREAEKWRYAVRKAKIGRYAVRKREGGCHPHLLQCNVERSDSLDLHTFSFVLKWHLRM